MYIYLLRRCDSSIGIGKATRHHEFNLQVKYLTDVEKMACTSIKYILYFWYYQIHFTWMNPDPVCSQRSGPDPVQIGPDLQHWSRGSIFLRYPGTFYRQWCGLDHFTEPDLDVSRFYEELEDIPIGTSPNTASEMTERHQHQCCGSEIFVIIVRIRIRL